MLLFAHVLTHICARICAKMATIWWQQISVWTRKWNQFPIGGSHCAVTDKTEHTVKTRPVIRESSGFDIYWEKPTKFGIARKVSWIVIQWYLNYVSTTYGSRPMAFYVWKIEKNFLPVFGIIFESYGFDIYQETLSNLVSLERYLQV